MDRANLEALTEEGEEEEEGWEDQSNFGRLAPSYMDDDDESSQEEGQDSTDDDDDDMDAREPNKFDNLCDGVISSMGLVQAALKEMLEFKDEVLRHALPPSVLVRLALVTSRVYRSVSDLQMPSNELIRMVRVYSTPWEEKSTALKKLHQDYESKQRQLNIAIKRLQLVDAHSKRIAREKRLMNWEKLFSKLTSAKGHGRRWKFLIESIKEKAKLGLEHVHEYARALEESSDEEEEEPVYEGVESRLSGKQGTEPCLDDHDTVTEAPTEVSATPAERADSDGDTSKDKDTTLDGSEPDSEEGAQSEEQHSEKAGPDIAITMTADSDHSSDYSRSGSAKRVRFEDTESLPVLEKPPMSDQTTWTHEPEYDKGLYVRVYAPQGLKEEQLRCVISLGKQVHKSGVLDPEEEEQEAQDEPEEPKDNKDSSKPSTPAKPKTPTKTDKGDEASTDVVEEVKVVKYFEEYTFELPEEMHSESKASDVQQLRVAVNYGPNEEMVAMATISYDEIKSMELPTIDLPPPKGDEPRLLVDMEVRNTEDTSSETPNPEDRMKDVSPTLVPLFSLRSGKGPCGQMPLVLYWGQRLKPRSFNKQTGTVGVNELVYDLTGIDLEVTTKENLNKEYRDEALSALAFTPEPHEETVTREEYDRMMERHKQELIMLQDEYETRLQGLMDNLRNMPTIQPPANTPYKEGQRSHSAGSRGHLERHSIHTSPINMDYKPEGNSPIKQPRPPSHSKPKKNFRVGRPLPKWGNDLPQDFLSRLQKYESETQKHRQALSDKLWQEVSKDIEQKLAGQHKLSERQAPDALEDVSLPALFMPFRTGNVFNPRAHQYFHPKGSSHMRLTQPPSVFQLPPLPQNKLAVLNLFNLSSNFQQPPSWLVERYIEQQQPTPQGAPPSTPAFLGGQTSSYTPPFPTMVRETTGARDQSQSYLPVSATSHGECER
ncbi:uncharacterized protein LOC135481989 isoform X2 [Liolophura sinensis]|uniref:uncharacterized protein LOC135481989 isoform X2 n=1 Tax=Liolophura sinensis TaxID=3198878 RepID=UPI0031596416